MPDVEVDGPQRQRDQRVGEELQPVDGPDAQDRREDRPGEAEDEQQRGDVAEQQVLAHVGDEQLLGEVVERADEGHEHDHEAAVEADLPPRRRRPPLAAQRPHARAVQPGDEEEGKELREDPEHGTSGYASTQGIRGGRGFGFCVALVGAGEGVGFDRRLVPRPLRGAANGGDEGGWARAPALSPGRSRAPNAALGRRGGFERLDDWCCYSNTKAPFARSNSSEWRFVPPIGGPMFRSLNEWRFVWAIGHPILRSLAVRPGPTPSSPPFAESAQRPAEAHPGPGPPPSSPPFAESTQRRAETDPAATSPPRARRSRAETDPR